MKNLSISLLLLLLSFPAWAFQVTFVPMGEYDTARPLSIVKDGVTLDITTGIDNGSHFRIYKGQQMIITSTVGPIINIAIECTASNNDLYGPGNFESDPPNYYYNDKIGYWEGYASKVTFTAVTGQVRVTKVTVTVEDHLMPPTINPAGGTYYAPIEVTMSSFIQGASIHYTTDGTTPTTSSTRYTSPIPLSDDITIKAIAVHDGEISEEVSETYTFKELSQYNCFEDAANVPDGTELRLNSPIVALAQYNSRLFVKDRCDGHALIYGNTGQTYKTGDIIPEGIVLTKCTYSGETEYTSPTYFKPASGNITIEPEEITGDQMCHDLFGHYVVLHNVTIIKEGSQYYVIDQNGNLIEVFWNMGISAPSNLNIHYDLYAIVGSYARENTVYQLLPVMLKPLQTFTLCDLPNVPDGETITFDQEATVLYQTGKNLYLRVDECYGLVYGETGQTYTTGDILAPGWGGTKEIFNDLPELIRLTGFQPPIRHEEIDPEIVTIPQIGHEIWAHYVRLEHVTIDQSQQLIFDQNGNSVPYYPQLPFTVEQAKLFNVTGIITAYGRNPTTYQFCFTNPYELLPPPPDVCCFRDLLPINYSCPVNFTYPLTVVYQNGQNLYVKDDCDDYGLIMGNAGGPFINGDLITGALTWNPSNGFRFATYSQWVSTGHDEPVEPECMPIEEVSMDMQYRYLRFENVKLLLDEKGNIYIGDETDQILLWDKFKIEIIPGMADTYNPCDVNLDYEVNIADINALIDHILSTLDPSGPMRIAIDDIDFNATYDVEGFMDVYKGEMELSPTMICYHGYPSIPDPEHRWDINGDGEVTIADINCIIDNIVQL